MTIRAEIEKQIELTLTPVLRETGFTLIQTWNSWAWRENVIWVFSLRTVGGSFSSVTKWPAHSLAAGLGVYYTFFPTTSHLQQDEMGRIIPDEPSCHVRFQLSCTLDQTAFTKSLPNAPEKMRTDIWWVERDGRNIPQVVDNIVIAYRVQGLEWFRQMSDLKHALQTIERERDSCYKYRRATYLARHLGDRARFRFYRERWKVEAQRINQADDTSLDSES